MKATKFALIATLLFGVACAGPEPDFRRAEARRENLTNSVEDSGSVPSVSMEAEGFGTPEVTVLLAPQDLTTAVTSAPEVVVLADPLDDRSAGIVAHAVRLRSLESGVSVAIDVEHVQPTTGTSDHHFLCVARETLADGWYELSVDQEAIREGLRGVLHLPGPARFHVGSRPVVRYPTFSPGDSVVGVALALSERVRDSRPAESLVNIQSGGRDVHCVSGPGDGLAGSLGTNAISLVCDPFPIDDEVVISIADDISSLSGRSLTFPFEESTTRLSIVPNRASEMPISELTFVPLLRPGESHAE